MGWGRIVLGYVNYGYLGFAWIGWCVKVGSLGMAYGWGLKRIWIVGLALDSSS